MRIRIKKGKSGRTQIGDKEVSVSIQKSGLKANGEQAYQMVVRFANRSWKKASDTDYVAIELDDELNRMYFLPANKDDGFKLSGNDSVRTAAFTIHGYEGEPKKLGDCELLKDVKEGHYYIDISDRTAALIGD